MTPAEIAAWMRGCVESQGCLHQDEAVHEIMIRFGEEFAYFNDNGNPAIVPAVLTAFRDATEDDVVWTRRYRFWRWREADDEPGREQP